MFENDKKRPPISLAYHVLREILSLDGSRINVTQIVLFIEINFLWYNIGASSKYVEI